MVCDAAKRKDRLDGTVRSLLQEPISPSFAPAFRSTYSCDGPVKNAELKSPLDLAFKDAYPSLAEAEWREAKVNFSRYIEISSRSWSMTSP